MKKNIIIAIDGPAGSGKSSTAKIVAEELDYIYIDTGAMYRAVTLACIRQNTEITDEALKELLENVEIELKASPAGQRTFLNGEDVSAEIRLPEVTKLVSPVSAAGCVREKMVELQRGLGRNGGVVMDGRDIGTVVFPGADLKIFLVATIDARAERRALELRNTGIEFSVEEIKNQISERDRYDSSREISPLRKASDAIEIDTSSLTIKEQCDKILAYANKIISA